MRCVLNRHLWYGFTFNQRRQRQTEGCHLQPRRTRSFALSGLLSGMFKPIDHILFGSLPANIGQRSQSSLISCLFISLTQGGICQGGLLRWRQALEFFESLPYLGFGRGALLGWDLCQRGLQLRFKIGRSGIRVLGCGGGLPKAGALLWRKRGDLACGLERLPIRLQIWVVGSLIQGNHFFQCKHSLSVTICLGVIPGQVEKSDTQFHQRISGRAGLARQRYSLFLVLDGAVQLSPLVGCARLLNRLQLWVFSPQRSPGVCRRRAAFQAGKHFLHLPGFRHTQPRKNVEPFMLAGAGGFDIAARLGHLTEFYCVESHHVNRLQRARQD